MTDFGAGVYLDEQLDMAIDSTGDIRGESGLSELQKDLAYNMILNLEQYLGHPPESNLEAKVAGTAHRVALADDRIDTVFKGETEVNFLSNKQEIELAMTVRADGTEQELVFNV